MTVYSFLLSLVIPLLFVVIYRKLNQLVSTGRNGPYPPGPKPKPFIGNMLDFPTTRPAEEYGEWRKKYNSDIVFASAFGNNLIILNNPEDAIELFQRRANKYSDRPPVPIMKLLGWDPAMVSMLRYGDQWRLHRKIMQQNFNIEASKKYRPVIHKKVFKLLQAFSETPEDFCHHNKMLGVSIPISLMYGYDIESIHDPVIEAAEKSVSLGAPLLAPGGSMINVFPVLGKIPPWFPGASSHKIAVEVRRLTDLVKQIPLDFVKKQMAEGAAAPSLVSDFLEKKNMVGASEEEEMAIQNIAYTIYGAAADTTISATGTFLYQMCINPEIQKKAQVEIDKVVGSTRLPSYEDRESLPYIEAIYREVLRWRPPLLLGIPHYSTEDDHYKGYFIPKDTNIIGNLWSASLLYPAFDKSDILIYAISLLSRGMAHNEEIYSDPYTFKPERFIDRNGELQEDPTPVYGFGRRICAGKYIASSTVWLTMALVLACFDLGKAKDELGNEIEIKDDYDDFTTISHKSPYKCSITPRFSLIPELIKGGLED